jgi:hypothetical protein
MAQGKFTGSAAISLQVQADIHSLPDVRRCIGDTDYSPFVTKPVRCDLHADDLVRQEIRRSEVNSEGKGASLRVQSL